jgi:hypothetical protein
MNNIRALIGQLKSELQEIQNKLSPWLNEADKTEKQNQLKAVAGSLDKLTKTEVTIPSELRELKLKLHRELDQFKEAKIIKAELDEMLSQFIIQKKSIRKRTPKKVLAKKNRKSTGIRIEILNLIQKGILDPQTKIVKHFKGIHYEATITNEGQIELLHNGVTVSHSTPSAAAEYLSKARQNGWTWWSLEGDTKGRTLDYYRQKYIQHGKETRR